MDLHSLLQKPLPAIPPEIRDALDTAHITPTPFAQKNDILKSPALQAEVGCAAMGDGSYLIAMTCPMPGITADMIAWWFWWHPQDSLRYQVWYPGSHISIRYPRRDRAYFQQPSMPAFAPNTQCPVERIGGSQMPLRIDFVRPEDFGFSRQLMAAHNIPVILCGHVSAFGRLIPHTEMAHIFRQTPDGLMMTSRFWMGQTLSPLLRRAIITPDMAREMAEHCCTEYRSLCRILPALYDEYR